MIKTVVLKIWKFFCSLQFAVTVILSLAFASMVGTVLESQYDTATARYWVYRAFWFRMILAALGINIFCVMMSRFPWKKHHAAFLLAHIGILSLLTGSWVTDRRGLDGTLRIEEGETANVVEMDEAQLVFSESDALQAVPVKWIPPGVGFNPIQVAQYGITADQFLSHAEADFSFPEVPAGTPGAAPWIKVQLAGGPMKIRQEFQLWGGDPGWNTIQAGPARLMLFRNALEVPKTLKKELEGQPWAAFFPKKGGGYSVEMGRKWKGGVELKVLEWKSFTTSRVQYRDARVQYGQQAPLSAIHLTTGKTGDGSDVWLGLGERATLQQMGRQIRIGYYPRRVSLPFAVKLHKFDIERYPGTFSPKEYASTVSVQDERNPQAASQSVLISMNEPLHHSGITFYQASYEEAQPRPTVSIFSVNRDPGRWLKYMGSIFLVSGIIWLFVTRWRKRVGGGAIDFHHNPGLLRRQND